MKIQHLLSGTIVATLLLVAPGTSLANKATETTVTRLSDSHVLYTMTFDLGFLNRATYVPFVTNTSNENLPSLQFSIENLENPDEVVSALGIVLTDETDLVNNYYALPYGDRASFTLNVIAAIPKNQADYKLTVNKLPYLLETKEKTVAQASFPQDQMANFTATLTQ